MSKGTVVKTSDVCPFKVDESYSSKMLIDKFNSESKGLNINEGTLAPGGATPGAAHPSPYDEIYYVVEGNAVLHMDGKDYDIGPGDVVYIPADTFHALDNKSKTECFRILTVWSIHPEKGANEVYDLRKEKWGTTYKTISGK